MKSLIKKMQLLESALETEKLKREEYFDCHSEKWQESEKGEEYQELTDRIQEMNDEVSDWIYEFSN